MTTHTDLAAQADRLAALLEREATHDGKADYKHAAARVMRELAALSTKRLAEGGGPAGAGVIVDAYAFPSATQFGDEIKVQRTRQIEGPALWKVVDGKGNCLNKSGEWEWEPMPSSRDDEFLSRCRFPTAAAAIDAVRGIGTPKEST